jgi:hypothetical protein
VDGAQIQVEIDKCLILDLADVNALFP